MHRGQDRLQPGHGGLQRLSDLLSPLLGGAFRLCYGDRGWHLTSLKRIAVISTGGTIEKTYDALEGVLSNRVNVLDIMIAQLDLRGVALVRVPLMNKDSLDMTHQDHTLISQTAAAMAAAHDGVIIVHGTDRLQNTGDRACELIPEPRVPIILTGAMRPYELRHTDALQNITEALLAVQILPPGIYAVMHNQVLTFPGVIKDRHAGHFVKTDGDTP